MTSNVSDGQGAVTTAKPVSGADEPTAGPCASVIVPGHVYCDRQPSLMRSNATSQSWLCAYVPENVIGGAAGVGVTGCVGVPSSSPPQAASASMPRSARPLVFFIAISRVRAGVHSPLAFACLDGKCGAVPCAAHAR